MHAQSCIQMHLLFRIMVAGRTFRCAGHCILLILGHAHSQKCMHPHDTQHLMDI